LQSSSRDNEWIFPFTRQLIELVVAIRVSPVYTHCHKTWIEVVKNEFETTGL